MHRAFQRRWKVCLFQSGKREKEQTGSVPVFNTNLNRLKKITASIASYKTEDGEEYTNETRLKYLGIILLTITVFMLITSNVYAEPDSIALPKLGFTVEPSDNPQMFDHYSDNCALTILSLAPSILIMMTSFVRIIIVLSFSGTRLEPNKCRRIKF